MHCAIGSDTILFGLSADFRVVSNTTEKCDNVTDCIEHYCRLSRDTLSDWICLSATPTHSELQKDSEIEWTWVSIIFICLISLLSIYSVVVTILLLRKNSHQRQKESEPLLIPESQEGKMYLSPSRYMD